MLKAIRYSLGALAFSLVLVGSVSIASDEIKSKLTPPPILDLSAINKKVNPCENFYEFACGAWIKKTPIPSDKPSVYRQWSTLDDITEEKLSKVLEGFRRRNLSLKTPHSKELGDFYGACMAPKKEDWQKSLDSRKKMISEINSPSTLAKAVAQLQLTGADVLFSFYVGQDLNDSTRMTAFFEQGGMGLPDRDFYFRTDEKSTHILAEYKKHIAKMLVLGGYKPKAAEESALNIFTFESRLAKSALQMDQRRDAVKTNHPMDRKQLAATSPKFDWSSFFIAASAPGINGMIVKEPLFMTEMDQAVQELANYPLIKDYLLWQTLHSVASSVGGEFEKENFHFMGQVLKGQKAMRPRWKVCTRLAGLAMRDVLAEAYVSLSHGEEAKAKTEEMIDTIKTVFDHNLDQLQWLDASTRTAAHKKIEKLGKKVAYPAQWRVYDGLKISRTDPLANTFAADEFDSLRMIKKIGGPVDRLNWEMPAWEANAYYDASMNEFVFPLGELLPPVLDLKASDGANFGALGATVGHELTHGFDDEGHQFDAEGNVKNWWTPAVQKQFEEKASCYSDQASKYEVMPKLFINGKATLGENLADQGGTRLAWIGYKNWAAKHHSAAKLGGFNEDQLFFISYAQSWCGKLQPEALRTQVTTDFHPPSIFRVNEVVLNMPEFAESFACKSGAAMAPVQRCSLW